MLIIKKSSLIQSITPLKMNMIPKMMKKRFGLGQSHSEHNKCNINKVLRDSKSSLIQNLDRALIMLDSSETCDHALTHA